MKTLWRAGTLLSIVLMCGTSISWNNSGDTGNPAPSKQDSSTGGTTGGTTGTTPSGTTGSSGGTVQLHGAGASFPAPLYLKWFKAYNGLHPDVQVDYQSVGSGSGVKAMIDKTVDFGRPAMQR